MKHARTVLLILSIATPVLAQELKPSASQPQNAAREEGIQPPDNTPVRVLKFEPLDASSSISLSPVTSVPQCDATGTLYLDVLESNDLRKHNLISIHDKKTQSYQLSAISDLRDIAFFGFSASDNEVAVLVRATKETAIAPGAGKSPAGYPWSSYHNYIAVFKNNGTYKYAIELSMKYQISHVAVLPSGEFLVVGFDNVNSVARLLFLDDSGRIVKTVDMPGARASGTTAPYGSVDAAKAARSIVGPVSFTPYGQHMLVWRRGTIDPILDVGPGGSVREVPLQVPAGYVFVEMVPSSDRWVAHFRSLQAPEDAPFTEKSYVYEELRPQDASIASKLTISGDVPQSIACEDGGTYLTYKRNDAGKIVLYSAR